MFSSHNCLSEHNVRISVFLEHLSDEFFVAIFGFVVFHDFNDVFSCLEITFRVIPHSSEIISVSAFTGDILTKSLHSFCFSAL